MNLIDWDNIARVLGEFDLLTSSGVGKIVLTSLAIIGAYAVLKKLLSKNGE